MIKIFVLASLLWGAYKEEVLQAQASIRGSCSREKAELLMDFIYETKPVVSVEIGAFAGATTFPMAAALQYLNQGLLYAIDVWDNQATVAGLEEGDPSRENWLNANIDMGQVRRAFFLGLANISFQRFCFPLACTSEQAALFFADQSIDLLYIDGNLSPEGTVQDVDIYWPKVKNGGYIWLNLANVDTKRKAVSLLMRRCEWIKERSLRNECILFKKIEGM